MKREYDEYIHGASIDEFLHAREKLEFGLVLDILASHAVGDRTASALRESTMLETTELVEQSQDTILEARGLLDRGEDLPVTGWVDSVPVLRRINAEGISAEPAELKSVADGESAAARLSAFLERWRSDFLLLSTYADRFRLQKGIVSLIGSAIGDEGEVVDGASPELKRIRKDLRTLRNRLRKAFAEFAQKKSRGKEYEFVTMRGERYVVSLPRGEAAGVKGIVHQSSASGASLYVEPLEFVEENNRLESLVQEEKREIERILRELTAAVFRVRDELLGNQAVILDLDSMRAKALFARRFSCTKPRHSDDGALHLRDARHPLLEKRFSDEGGERSVKPLELELEPELKALVISGPNAGGKTVALKTVGLVVLMDRTGLLVPCKEDSLLPEYRRLFVDIGDDQSIEKSLSTFSSRVARMKSILGDVDGSSLVLVDEIGDGTDPEEGAALAEAVLENLLQVCGRTIVTTHLSPLKGWAHETSGAGNATLEFDPERLEPLFRMRMGIPGRSWGIEMAGRMGLPARIIQEAKEHLGQETLRLEELLAHLERMERTVVLEQQELERKEKALTELIETYRSGIDSLRKDRDELKRQAQEEALEIVSSTRREMEGLIRDIRVAQAEKEVIRKARREVEERKRSFEKTISSMKRRTGLLRIEDMKEGAWYEIERLGQKGRMLSIRSATGRVILELPGGLRVETSVDDLSPAEDECRDQDRSVSWSALRSDGEITTELMVRGMERQDALEEVDRFIDKAVLHGLHRVTIIHGVGKGILRRAIYDSLKRDPRVREIHPGEPAAGGDGVAVVELK
jgi:DNA mismatch repair protein MutS2